MNITLTGNKITQDTKFLAFEKNNSVDVINITVDTDESWEYKLDVKYPDKCCAGEALYNIINLTRNGNVCTAILTSDMLPFAGKYTMQLRGINGDKVSHSDTFDTWIKYSIEPGSTYDPVPSEFYQIEANVTEMNNNPPYPSDDGYWMIWDTATHTYKKSDIKVANGLPEISESTKGQYLTNDGAEAKWADVDALPAISADTKSKVLTNDGEKAEWGGAVRYDVEQSLTNTQETLARQNIGLTPVAKTDAMTQSVGYDVETGELYTAPSAGGISLGITGATVGQIAKITAVDADGKPTAWKAVTPEPWNFVMADGTTVTKKVYVDADE